MAVTLLVAARAGLVPAALEPVVKAASVTVAPRPVVAQPASRPAAAGPVVVVVAVVVVPAVSPPPNNSAVGRSLLDFKNSRLPHEGDGCFFSGVWKTFRALAAPPLRPAHFSALGAAGPGPVMALVILRQRISQSAQLDSHSSPAYFFRAAGRMTAVAFASAAAFVCSFHFR